jgi:hypothetical protein
MASAPPVFTDSEAYERMMGRWSRLAGEMCLDWLVLFYGACANAVKGKVS